MAPSRSLYDDGIYSEYHLGACSGTIKDHQLALDPAYQFWNNRIHSVLVEAPACRVVG